MPSTSIDSPGKEPPVSPAGAETRLVVTNLKHPVLPPDVLLLIVEAVGESDHSIRTRNSQLCALALTCRSLRSRSQALLFKSPFLYDWHKYAPFSRALEDSPELSRLVRSITLAVRNNDEDMPLPPHIVARLTNLESADFNGDWDPFNSGTFSQAVRRSQPNAHQVTFVGFKCQNFAELVRLVWSFPHITSLLLGSFMWGGEPHQGSERDSLPAVERYPRPACHLTSLTLYLYSRLNLALPVWGECVRDLTIHGANRVDNFEGISAFRALESLCLGFYGTDLGPLIPALTSIRSPAFRRLAVEHRVPKGERRASTLAQIKGLHLDAILTPEAFPQLREVAWTVIFPRYPNTGTGTGEREPKEAELSWVNGIGRRMPGVRDSGLLRCKIVRASPARHSCSGVREVTV
ncbi:hypothetical protein LXA43DRAFT_1026955 [Ganoderma leucocontextum]|nr:hypothetical protein LXA43DRAFT_1026955 [Ganoderma leucocontextum]